jgi:TldD protein
MTILLSEPLQIAETKLLDPNGLTFATLEQGVHRVLHYGVDLADIYLQFIQGEAWSLEEGVLKGGSFGIDQGVGVRAVSGEKAVYAYSDEISPAIIQELAQSAKAIAQHGASKKVFLPTAGKLKALYQPIDPSLSLSSEEKTSILQAIDSHCRKADPRVKEVMASLSAEYSIVLIMREDGSMAADARPLVHLSVTVIVEAQGKRETGRAGGGGRFGLQEFDAKTIRHYGDEAVRQALVNLDAKPAPAGTLTVLLGSGWPGVLLHEAVGHGLEGDFNRKGTSAFSGKIGEKVAANGVTVVDDGTIPLRRGSLTVDDEGTPTQRNVLIEDGVLKGYLMDRQNAMLMGATSTGSGRRESYSCLPMPRMTNTFMLKGPYNQEEMLSAVKYGIYCANFSGGQVDITNGKFVFSASEAYLIENGKITAPIKGAMLIGNGPDVLTRVKMIGNDLALDPGIGTCGKDGQSVPVGVGQPSLLIDGLTVGGTEA